MQGGSSEGGVQEIKQVSAEAFQMVLRYLYTAELPESGEGGAGAGGGRGEGSSGGGERGGGKGKEQGSKGKGGKGAGGNGGKSKGEGEEAKGRQVLEREVLKAADLLRLEALLWSTAWRRSGEGWRWIRRSRSWCGRTATGQRRRARWRQSTLFAIAGAFGLSSYTTIC